MRIPLLAALLACLPTVAGAATVNLTVLDTAGRPLPNAVVSLKPAAFRGAPQFAYPTAVAQRDI